MSPREAVYETLSRADLARWSSAAESGEYLIEYEDTGMSDDEDPGSRCGYTDAELQEVRDALAVRGLTLSADDRGLLAEVQTREDDEDRAYGLTFGAWLSATDLRAAWRAGESPSEYRVQS